MALVALVVMLALELADCRELVLMAELVALVD